ncbi:MAG TPA: GGDEF domain-containing protein [Methylophilaceae bacterium]
MSLIFDFNTIVFMVAVLTFMLSGLLLLAGLNRGDAQGSRHWALANILLSIGLAMSFTQFFLTHSWCFVFGAVLLTAGMSLQYVGLQKFKREPVTWWVPVSAVLAVFVMTMWFHAINHDTQGRMVANSLIYAAINIACARLVLVPAPAPLKTAYRFTGITFLALAGTMIGRAVLSYIEPSQSFVNQLFPPVSPRLFFVGSMMQMCLTFGFVLMMNYRLVTDLRVLAIRDPLTGILNRRSLEDEASYLLARCHRNSEVMTMMMIDVDHFKAVNDEYGHQAGDEVLKHLVNIVNTTIRTGDYFARYGGEEFCVMLPLTTKEEALVLAERLRQKYADTPIQFDSKSIQSTISIGLTDTHQSGVQFVNLVSLADQAMYQAKRAGRNQVVVSTHPDAVS